MLRRHQGGTSFISLLGSDAARVSGRPQIRPCPGTAEHTHGSHLGKVMYKVHLHTRFLRCQTWHTEIHRHTQCGSRRHTAHQTARIYSSQYCTHVTPHGAPHPSRIRRPPRHRPRPCESAARARGRRARAAARARGGERARRRARGGERIRRACAYVARPTPSAPSPRTPSAALATREHLYI